jgi:hypothetical protein
LFPAMTGTFTPAYSVSKRTGSDGPTMRVSRVVAMAEGGVVVLAGVDHCAVKGAVTRLFLASI